MEVDEAIDKILLLGSGSLHPTYGLEVEVDEAIDTEYQKEALTICRFKNPIGKHYN